MKEFLNTCTRVEKVVAEIYRELAARQDYDAKLRGAFLQLARDEEDHARQLGYALEFPAGTFAQKGWRDQADRLLEKAQGTLGALRRQPVPAAEAVRLAGWLEKDFRQVHLDAAAVFPSGRLRDTFSSLARAEGEHLATLRPFMKK